MKNRLVWIIFKDIDFFRETSFSQDLKRIIANVWMIIVACFNWWSYFINKMYVKNILCIAVGFTLAVLTNKLCSTQCVQNLICMEFDYIKIFLYFFRASTKRLVSFMVCCFQTVGFMKKEYVCIEYRKGSESCMISFSE